MLWWHLQFYGRGLFGTPPVTWIGGPYHGVFGAVRRAAFAPFALLSAALDQPVRNLSGGEGSWFVRVLALELIARGHCKDVGCPLLRLHFHVSFPHWQG